MRHIEKWVDRYKGLTIEASRHSVSEFMPNGIWCGYLYLNSQDNPEILERRGKLETHTFLPYIERHDPWFDRFKWNGSITFYEETVCLNCVVRMQIGHDYAHSWDREEDRDRYYNEQYILGEMRFICDAYRAEYPETT